MHILQTRSLMHNHKVTCPRHSPRYFGFGALALGLTGMLVEEQDRTVQTASPGRQRLREPRLGSRGGEGKWGALSRLKVSLQRERVVEELCPSSPFVPSEEW